MKIYRLNGVIIIESIGDDFKPELSQTEIEGDFFRFYYDGKKQIGRDYLFFTDVDNNSFSSSIELKTYVDAEISNAEQWGNSIVTNDTLVDSVIPTDGWIAKSVNGNFTMCMLEHAYYKGSPVINLVSNTPLVTSPLFWDFNFQRIGHYEVSVSFCGSVDSTGTDLISKLLVDGTELANINNGETSRIEGKDSAGNDLDGRGTDQKRPIAKKYHVEISSTGIKQIKLDHFTNQNGVECALWDVSIKVEEIFNPQIKQ